jgi:putative oxidoreductase
MTESGAATLADRLAWIARIAIGLMLLVAGLSKIGAEQTFATQIHHFRLVPLGLENLLAMTLPWIEIAAALAILLGIHPRAGSAVGAALLAVFLVAVAAALARGLDIECGCFGTGDGSRVGLSKLLQNLGLLAIAMVGCRRSRRRAS